jgi:hypothetical protein
MRSEIQIQIITVKTDGRVMARYYAILSPISPEVQMSLQHEGVKIKFETQLNERREFQSYSGLIKIHESFYISRREAI